MNSKLLDEENFDELKRYYTKDFYCDHDSKDKIINVIIPQIKKNLERNEVDKPETWGEIFLDLRYFLNNLMSSISKSNSDDQPSFGEDYQQPLSLNNNYMPMNFNDGIPKAWHNPSQYAPFNMDRIQSDYEEYKSKPYLRCDYLDYVFLKNLIYGSYSTDYFIVLFRKGSQSIKYGLMEAFTNGKISKIFLYKFICNIFSFLFFMINPLIAYFSFKYGVSWLGWIFVVFTGLSILAIPLQVWNYFFNIKKWEKNYLKKIEVSYKAYDHITHGNINPEILKKIITKNDTNFEIFLDTSIYAIVDDLIEKHKNYFSPVAIT